MKKLHLNFQQAAESAHDEENKARNKQKKNYVSKFEYKGQCHLPRSHSRTEQIFDVYSGEDIILSPDDKTDIPGSCLAI